jgi:hypothetical protein
VGGWDIRRCSWMKKGRCGRPGRTAWDARLKWMNPIRPQPPFGFTGGGGGGAAPPSPPKAAPLRPTIPQRLARAVSFGDRYSLAGALGVQNNAILNAFLGNTVSGLVNVGRTIFGQGGAPSPAAVALTGLGLPSGGPGAMGVAGMAQGAAAKARWNCASLYFQGKIPLCARNDMVRSFFQSPLRNGCAR